MQYVYRWENICRVLCLNIYYLYARSRSVSPHKGVLFLPLFTRCLSSLYLSYTTPHPDRTGQSPPRKSTIGSSLQGWGNRKFDRTDGEAIRGLVGQRLSFIQQVRDNVTFICGHWFVIMMMRQCWTFLEWELFQSSRMVGEDYRMRINRVR